MIIELRIKGATVDVSLSDTEKETLIRIAQALLPFREEIQRTWEQLHLGEPGIQPVIQLRKRHLNRFLETISRGNFQEWEASLVGEAQELMRRQRSLALGSSLDFWAAPGCLDRILKGMGTEGWEWVLKVLDLFYLYNLEQVVRNVPLKSRAEGPPNQEVDPLTPRERQVLRLVASGYTSKEIARQLGIAIKTVETHRANLMKKLGVRNMAMLVRYAWEQGICDGHGGTQEPGRPHSGLRRLSPSSQSDSSDSDPEGISGPDLHSPGRMPG